MNTTNTSALEVAKYLLNIANKEGDLISNLKLQKLLYYAQAWYLVNHDMPLFKEPIEAWALGPVVKEVYSQFKKFKASPINYQSTNQEAQVFTRKQIRYLDEFYDVFSKFTAHELVNMTHNDSPWKETFEKNENEIPLEAMKKYYTKALKERKNATRQ